MGEPALKDTNRADLQHRFKPGESGNPAGKPKGALAHRTREVQTVAYRLVNDPKYRKRLRERLREGTAGQMELTLWYYAFGKPKETIEYRGDPLVLQQLLVEVISARENGNGNVIAVEVEAGNGKGHEEENE